MLYHTGTFSNFLKTQTYLNTQMNLGEANNFYKGNIFTKGTTGVHCKHTYTALQAYGKQVKLPHATIQFVF